MNTKDLYQIYQKHSNICTDSRKVQEGDLFFALAGDNFDGNKFAAAALEKGAAYVVVDSPSICINDKYLLVKDTLLALQKLAQMHRTNFKIPIIGLTGSNGKTTTKELIAAILEQKYKIHATKGNFNNHIGVPLTLLSMPSNTEIAVIEMGANHLKEINFLCKIANPTHGLVNNVGKAHLEGFGSFEGVCQTKAELFEWLAAHKGTAFVNLDEKHLETLSANVDDRIFYQQVKKEQKSSTQELALLINATPFVKFSLFDKSERIIVQSHLIGDYNFNNILSAIAIAKYFDISNQAIKTAIENYKPQNNRSQFRKQGNNAFIMDAYNANPVSMEKALLSFSNMENQKGQKIAILGDMLELGAATEKEHQKIIDLSETLAIDQVVFVGIEFGKALEGTTFLHFKNVTATKKWFKAQQVSHATILLKGSRGIRLEEILA